MPEHRANVVPPFWEDMQMFSQILDSLAAGQTGHPNDAGAAVATARRQRSPVLLERSKEAEVVQITVDKDRVRGEGGQGQ